MAPEEVYTAAEEFGEHFLLHFKFNQNQQVNFFESDSLESGSSGVKHIIISLRWFSIGQCPIYIT